MEPLGEEWRRRRTNTVNHLADLTVVEYAEQRLAKVQRAIAPLGVRVERGSQYFERFMAACLAAELRAGEQTLRRETKRKDFTHTHPGAIQGPWRKASPARAAEPIIVPPKKAAPAIAAQPPAGHTLADCLAQWKVNREHAKKPIDPHLTNDMENVFAWFREHAGVDDIGQITRRQVIAFRDHMAKEKGYKVRPHCDPPSARRQAQGLCGSSFRGR
jgi:hypothetical protein